MSHPIFLYDGVCGLCNRTVQFVLKHDRQAQFRFAALQSRLGAHILSCHGADPTALDTVYVVLNYEPSARQAHPESLLMRSDAAIYILEQLGGFWTVAALALRLLPRSVRDWGYRIIARHRYRIFGRYERCTPPTPATRSRFLDQ